MTATTTADTHDGTYGPTVTRECIAQHDPTAPDTEPPDGEVRRPRFIVGIGAADDSLDAYGSPVTVERVERLRDDTEGRYRAGLRNDLPEFEEQKPSVEPFARVVRDRPFEVLPEETPDGATVRPREDDPAWASHRTAR